MRNFTREKSVGPMAACGFVIARVTQINPPNTIINNNIKIISLLRMDAYG